MNSDYLVGYANAGLYTMQGRLSAPEDNRFQSFPRSSWQREIELIRQVPLRGIEWIYDLYGAGANPIETAEGRQQLQFKLRQSGVKVVSICADYFMDCPFIDPDLPTRKQSESRLHWLISVCPELSIERIVLPFVDNSRISTPHETAIVLDLLHSVLPTAQEAGVELHLETDMDPANFRDFLNEINHPLVKVNYDCGNSSGLGYKPSDEFSAYGDRIGSFHIKDRILGGTTVPLGLGSTDFKTLRACLLDIDYRGDFVLQVARGLSGDELVWLSTMNIRACQWLRGDTNLDSGA